MLVSWNQFAIIFGQLVVYFVNFMILGDHEMPEIVSIGQGVNAVLPHSDQWTITTGWRYMFGSEMIPAALFTILICFVPESPRYLVSVGKFDDAQHVLSRINGMRQAQVILEEIKETMHTKTEKLFTYGWMCIFVGIMLSVFQQAVGINAVLYYAPRIYDAMGFDNEMTVTIFTGIVNIIFTLVAIFTVERLGRRPLLIVGSIGMAVGAFGVAVSFGQPGMEEVCMANLLIYSACFMFSWGPICWVLIAEVFPNTIRGAAVAIAVAFQWVFNFIVSSSFVPLFNLHLTEGDHFGHWFTYGLYGVICILAAVFVWKLVPETKGKTLEDMTALWLHHLMGDYPAMVGAVFVPAEQTPAETPFMKLDDVMAAIAEKYPKAKAVSQLRGDNDFIFSFVIKAVGILPADITSIYLGATGVSYKPYILGGTLGMSALAISSTVLGTSITDPHSPGFYISLGVQAILMTATLVFAFIYKKKFSKGNTDT
jgi:MFS family permease